MQKISGKISGAAAEDVGRAWRKESTPSSMGRATPAAEARGQSTAAGFRWTRFTLVLFAVSLTAFNGAVFYYKWNPITPMWDARKPVPLVRKKVEPTLRRFLPDPNETNRSLGITSALTSTYRLVDKALHVGDTAHFVIQAKDAAGRNKTFGGDFWFPVLTSGAAGAHPTTGGRTAGSVVDHNNGTYSVFFYAGWKGFAYVHIVLAAPSEATKWLREKFWPVEKHVFWLATFSGENPQHNKSITETTLCYLLRNVTSSGHCIVDYQPKATGLTALHCGKPKTTLTCDDLRTLQLDVPTLTVTMKQLVGGEDRLFGGTNKMQRLLRGPQNVSIGKSPNMTRMESRAPVCKPDVNRLVNDGFWLDQKWNYFQCQVRRWNDPAAVKECLRHKYVYILADSTVRSWYGEITRKLGLPWKHLGKGKYAFVMNNYHAQADLNMTFRFYPRVVSRAQLSINMTLYEVDLLDAIPSQDCGRYIIVFSPWAHFTQWTRESYTERAVLLKEAVLRFRERCPDVPIVIKGSHPREHENAHTTILCSDYTIRALGRTLREMFQGTGVYYYDVWQMNMAYGPAHIHMPTAVISEEVNWLLSYVCG